MNFLDFSWEFKRLTIPSKFCFDLQWNVHSGINPRLVLLNSQTTIMELIHILSVKSQIQSEGGNDSWSLNQSNKVTLEKWSKIMNTFSAVLTLNHHYKFNLEELSASGFSVCLKNWHLSEYLKRFCFEHRSRHLRWKTWC